jgi:3-oxoacyl-[acyl-carrier protein] reductase
MMTGRLADKVAIIVGAARGIGEGIAECFCEQGAHVVIADDDPVGEQTAEYLNETGNAMFTRTDVSQREQIERLVRSTVEHYGTVDILVQNAGIYPWTLIEDIEVEEWDRVLGVNLRGCFLTAQACLPVMKKRRYGRMIFTSSITGPRVSSPGHGHYAASKAGINGFIRTAALEFASYGITVNGIEPGNIMTEGMRTHRSEAFIQSMEASVPLGRLGTPRDVANACLFLASEESSYITGTTIIVDGGQILPESRDLSIGPGA